MSYTLTGRQLQIICPNLTLTRANKIAEDINFITPSYKINDADVLQEFIAQMAHESGGFRIKDENLNYKTPQRIVEIWPTRFTIGNSNGKADARLYINNPEKLANKVYGGRMGNDFKMDGYNNRGAGFMQITGKDAANGYGEFWSIEPTEIMNLCRTQDWWALDSACWLFAINKKLIQLAKADNFLIITRRINGGTIGLQSREKYYERTKKYLV